MAIESASPQVAIATLSSTEVVTAYALPSGTLAVEAFPIDATGLPTPVSTVGYQNGNLTSNQVLPAQNGVFASQVSIAAVNANQVITAIGDSSESMWVTTWGVNSGVQAQQLQQIPNVVGSYPGSVAVGAGQESVLVPGIGLRPPHVETVQSAFTPCVTAEGTMNVLYWTVSATGQLTQQPAVTPKLLISGVAATMLPANAPITSYHSAPGIGQTEEFYHGYSQEAIRGQRVSAFFPAGFRLTGAIRVRSLLPRKEAAGLRLFYRITPISSQQVRITTLTLCMSMCFPI